MNIYDQDEDVAARVGGEPRGVISYMVKCEAVIPTMGCPEGGVCWRVSRGTRC